MYVSELIVTPFSLFNKRNAKIIWECIFGASRRVSFSYFPKIALDHRGAPPLNTFQNFRGSCYNIQFKPYAESEMELFVTKNR